MHGIGHACPIGIPGHQIGHRRTLAQQIGLHAARPDKIGRAQHFKGTAHLPTVEVALLPHHVFKEMHLGIVDEQADFARFGKIHLRRQKAERGKAPVVVAGHGCRHDRQQRAAKAIAAAMHPGRPGDRRHRCHRRQHAVAPIAVHPDVAIFGAGIAPRNCEHGEPCRDELADQRIVRRQVEHIIFHDPGGHEQHRFGVRGCRRRRVLQQFDQVVAEHHLAGRHGQVAPHDKGFGTHRRVAPHQLLPIFGKQSQPFDQVHPAGRQHPLLHDRVCGREIGWRHHVEQLAHDEAHNHFMVRRYPGIVARRRVEPLLAQQERLLVQPERQPLPFGRIEAMVLRQGFDAPTRFGILRGSAHGIIAEPLPFARRLGHQQQLPPRRAGQMQRPIGKCDTKRVRRDAIGHLRH